MSSGFDNPRQTWDARFAGDEYIFGTAPNVFLAAQRPRLAAGSRALAVADGEGRNSVWLAQQGLAVTAFDIAPRGVERARALAERAGVAVDYHVASVEDWPWTPAAFDVVAAIFVQFAAPAVRERMFAGMLGTLKPGGWLLLQGYTPRQLEYRTGGPPRADHLYTPGLLRRAFAGHEIVELRSHDDVLAEGTQHAGMSALIDCVVRRR
ncbi:MAG: class I SAM-dependent methyltransferase [Burkholderiaceae bacterium]|jgi:SAM-dependent methyltransferase|nr:class I SAM-dependent methyltransferase [Burkholderiaceae bacterium]